MNHQQGPTLLVLILIIVAGTVFFLAWKNATWSVGYADLTTVLTTTTATFGTLLGIITAGLMFTHGKFSELESELNEKSPDYLSEVLLLEKVQLVGSHLLSLRQKFFKLQSEATVVEEKNLYKRIGENASLMFINFAVLLNLKLRQKGLMDVGFLASEMDPELYARYQKAGRKVNKEWKILATLKQVVDIWEGQLSSVIEKSERGTSLQSDLKGSISILELKERIDKGSKGIHAEVAKAVDDLNEEISRIQRSLHRDRIPQLLSEMNHAGALRGRYFYLALVFIAAPLFVDLIILPQLSESTAPFFKQMILATSSLSVMGFIFLLLYIHKLLSK
jgi:hypothetical protein